MRTYFRPVKIISEKAANIRVIFRRISELEIEVSIVTNRNRSGDALFKCPPIRIKPAAPFRIWGWNQRIVEGDARIACAPVRVVHVDHKQAGFHTRAHVETGTLRESGGTRPAATQTFATLRDFFLSAGPADAFFSPEKGVARLRLLPERSAPCDRRRSHSRTRARQTAEDAAPARRDAGTVSPRHTATARCRSSSRVCNASCGTTR